MTGRAGRRGLDSVGHAVVAVVPAGGDGRASPRWPPRPHRICGRRSDPPTTWRSTWCAGTASIRPTTSWTAPSPSSSTAAITTPCPGVSIGRCALLEQFGYVDADAWRLTARGVLLAGIYHESDLLVAEALAEGIFDGLEAAELAAVVSACTFETRPGARAARDRRRPRSPASPAPGHGRTRRAPARRGTGVEPGAHPARPTTASPMWRGAGPGAAPRPGPRARRARARGLRAQRQAAHRPVAPAVGRGAVPTPPSRRAVRSSRSSAAWWRHRRARRCRSTTSGPRHRPRGPDRAPRGRAHRLPERGGGGLGAGNRGSATPASRRS